MRSLVLVRATWPGVKNDGGNQVSALAAYGAVETELYRRCGAARRKYCATTEAAYAIKKYASDLYIAATDSEDDGEAVRAVARKFGKTYDLICYAASKEVEAEIAAAHAAYNAENVRISKEYPQ